MPTNHSISSAMLRPSSRITHLRAAATSVNPCTGARGATSHGTSVAVDLPGCSIRWLDGASWHNSHGLVVPNNITLLALPPYSPELNPVERIWHYLRSHWLANSVLRDG